MYQKIKLGALALLTVMLAACSSGKLVKTYEGEALMKESVAVLSAPENISLVSVNGKRVPQYLLSTIDVNYGLKPGVNVVVFEYESVWAIAKKGDGPRSELVQSERKEVVIDAVAGEHYTFKYDQVENLVQARELANGFVADVIDGLGEVVATSTAQGIYSTPVVNSSNGSSLAQPVAIAQGAKAGSELPTIDALKVLWKSASAEDKKAFLQWAFEK